MNWTTQLTVTPAPHPGNPERSTPTPSPAAVSATYLRLVATAYPSAGTDPYAHVALEELGWDGHGATFPAAFSANTTCASDAPANAIDNNTATWWQPVAATVNPTVAVDLGTPTTLSAVSTTWYSPAFAPSAYQIQTSPDGVNWTTQLTVSADTGPANNPGPAFNHACGAR